MRKFPNYRQIDSKDCGPTCLKIIGKHFGKILSIDRIRTLSETTRLGSSLTNLSNAAEKIGLRTLGVKFSLNELKEAPLPCILHWNNNHYVVLYKIRKDFFFISDPAHGLLKYTKDEFLKSWIGNNAIEGSNEGISLLVEATPKFYENNFGDREEKINLSYLSKYLLKYKRFLWQLVIGLLARKLVAANFSISYPERCRCWHKESGYKLCLFNTVRSVGFVRRAAHQLR